MWQCSKLKELPTSIGQLMTLQKFKLSKHFELKELPTSISQLTTLQKLNLSGFPKLKELPTSIGKLMASQKLDLLSLKDKHVFFTALCGSILVSKDILQLKSF
jgi:Leucine-rich repeat (LRR) protein